MLNRVLKAARKADKRVRKDNYFRQHQNIEDRSRCRDPRFCPATLPQARQDRRLCGLFFDNADEPLLKMRTKPFIFSGLSAGKECGRVMGSRRYDPSGGGIPDGPCRPYVDNVGEQRRSAGSIEPHGRYETPSARQWLGCAPVIPQSSRTAMYLETAIP